MDEIKRAIRIGYDFNSSVPCFHLVADERAIKLENINNWPQGQPAPQPPWVRYSVKRGHLNLHLKTGMQPGEIAIKVHNLHPAAPDMWVGIKPLSPKDPIEDNPGRTKVPRNLAQTLNIKQGLLSVGEGADVEIEPEMHCGNHELDNVTHTSIHVEC